MKRLTLFCGMIVAGLSVANAVNISRVTYFPISYVAYHNLNANTMDIGLTSSSNIQLGTDNVAVAPLTAGATNVAGTLKLNGVGVTSTGPVEVGNAEDDGNLHVAKLTFSNLQLGNGSSISNLNTNDMKVDSLSLFGQTFPKCKGTGGDETGEMHWVKLKLSASAACQWYLACGEVTGHQCVDKFLKDFELTDIDLSSVEYLWVVKSTNLSSTPHPYYTCASLAGNDDRPYSCPAEGKSYAANAWLIPGCNADNLGKICYGRCGLDGNKHYAVECKKKGS